MSVADDLRGRSVLPEGVRWIEKGDTCCEFWTDDLVMANHKLEDDYRWSLEPESLVLVRELPGPKPVAAVLYASIRRDYLMIEMVVRNKHALYRGSGALLVSTLARFIESDHRHAGRASHRGGPREGARRALGVSA